MSRRGVLWSDNLEDVIELPPEDESSDDLELGAEESG